MYVTSTAACDVTYLNDFGFVEFVGVLYVFLVVFDAL